MSTPQRNATLLTISAPEGAETWGGETAGPATWSGHEGIYVERTAARGRSGQNADLPTTYTIHLSHRVPDLVVGQSVTFQEDGQPVVVAPVAAVNPRTPPRSAAIPAYLRIQTIRLEPVGSNPAE